MTRTRAALVAASLLSALLVVVVLPATPAVAAPLAATTVITNNIQGSTAGGDSKWTHPIANYAHDAPVVLLQEAGPSGPPLSYDPTTGQVAAPEPVIHTAGGDVQPYTWFPRSTGRQNDGPYSVYYASTDTSAVAGAGGRVNLAIVLRGVAEEVLVVPSPIQAGRAALGVRLGNNWYFTFHGLSGSAQRNSGGGDSAIMLAAVDQTVMARNPAYRWTVGGDFNLDPSVLAQRPNFPANATIHNSGLATHQDGGEYDYFVTNEVIPAPIPRTHRLDGSSPDHYAIQIGNIQAAAENVDVKVMDLGDATTGSIPTDTLFGMEDWYHVGVVGSYRRSLEFVGSQPGTNGGPPYEGAYHEEISAIAARAATAINRDKPNIVLLQAGTYDIAGGDQSGAADRLSALIDQIQVASPNTVVAVATVGPAVNPDLRSRLAAYNDGILQIVAQKQAAGRHVVLANLSLTVADLSSDGLTPNAAGEQKVADGFLTAFMNAEMDGFIEESVDGGGSSAPGAPFGQQIAMAAYSNPTGDPAAWARLIGADSSKASILVANVLNGPGSEANSDWANVIAQAHASGKKVLGYVDTGYLGQADNRLTRLGSGNISDWIAQIDQDTNTWYRLYGSSMDGIFFDDGFNECGADNEFPGWYSEVNDYAKRHHPGALTVLNPGTVVPQCYENAADILLTFEGSYASYRSGYNLGWTPSSRSKIWHIIYGVPEDDIVQVAVMAQARNAGYVEITGDSGANPYDQQPDDAYWNVEQGAVEGGRPVVAPVTPFVPDSRPAPAAPRALGQPPVTDYSSSNIGWTQVSDAAHYLVYLDGQIAASFPAGVDRATIGGLAPGGNTYRLYVTAQNSAGHESAPSPTYTVTTMSLPNGMPIANLRVYDATIGTRYAADWLLPASFRRIYVGYYDYELPAGTPCWPINYNDTHYFCATSMVENTTYLKYVGTGTDWSWTVAGNSVPKLQGQYGRDWFLPVPLNSTIALQAEGYEPLTTVFYKCPTQGGAVSGTGRYCTN